MDAEMIATQAGLAAQAAAETERALARLRKGEYGVCEVCNREIGIPRLIAVPFATRCIRCQQAFEATARVE
jgi:RNA polymerase-binding transcription factor DksA